MNLIERYAVTAGAKIDKPHINTSFYPIEVEKYITINFGSSNMAAKYYDYAALVLEFLHPILKEAGIEIVQLGDKDEPQLPFCHRFAGVTNLAQSSYILKNSLLHLGCDSALVHSASVFDVPVVALYSVAGPDSCGMYFGNKSHQIALEPEFPEGITYSYNPQEQIKSVNSIKPESIVAAVCKLLNLEYKPFKTLRMGAKFLHPIIDLIPNNLLPPEAIQGAVVNIRLDKGGAENVVYEQLRLRKSIVVTPQALNKDALRALKGNLVKLFYLVGENEYQNPNILVDFLKFLQQEAIQFETVTLLDEEKTNDLKIKLYDYCILYHPDVFFGEFKGELPLGESNTFFKTSRRILSNGAAHLSYAHENAKISVDNIQINGQNVIDSSDFLKEAEYFYIYQYV